jgi:hypothetical protein
MVQVDDSDGLTYQVSTFMYPFFFYPIYLCEFFWTSFTYFGGQLNANTLQLVLQPYLDAHIYPGKDIEVKDK